MSIGLLILRLVVGALFIGHGSQKLFGWFGGRGRSGTAAFFESLGYRPGRVMALLAGCSELGGGMLLTLGFLTPLGAAAAIGVMVNAAVAIHLRKGLWNAAGGFELPLTNAVAATALAFTRAGRYSIDHLIGFAPSHVASGIFAVVLGVASAIVLLVMRQRTLGAHHEPHARGDQRRAV